MLDSSSSNASDLSGSSRGEAISFGVSTLRLRSFRNYLDQAVEFSSGLNVVHGPNAQGKTNLLEALFLLATSRLLRGQRDQEAIREGSDSASVEATLMGSETLLRMSIERGTRKRAYLNGASLPKASDLLGRMPCVCVSVLDLETIRGEPAERRLFLDLELSALYPSYLRHLASYRRSLEHRNALLRLRREQHVPADSFEVWEAPMAEHGMALRAARREYVARLSPELARYQALMGQGEALAALEAPADDSTDPEAFLALLAAQRDSDVGRGSTSVGPHRDDLALQVDGRVARLYGSQGQQRTAAISLKLAALAVASEVLKAQPILLLDDIFSDLDQSRRETLVRIVLDHGGQTVLTCTEPEIAGREILAKSRLFKVRAGTVEAS